MIELIVRLNEMEPGETQFVTFTNGAEFKLFKDWDETEDISPVNDEATEMINDLLGDD